MINQKGGFVDTLVNILKTILFDIVIPVLRVFAKIIGPLFKILPKEDFSEFNRVGELLPSSNRRIDWGLAWKYIYWCIKTVIYLIIFCFGGPIVILIGIIYLYSSLFKKLSVRNDKEDENKKT